MRRLLPVLVAGRSRAQIEQLELRLEDYEAQASPIAKEALERIADLYAIEQEIRGASGRTRTGTPDKSETVVGFFARVVRNDFTHAVPQVGYDGGYSLCPFAMACLAAVPRRRADRDRQQPGLYR